MREPYDVSPETTIYCGHVLDLLKDLPAASVQCVVTSPPYWGLRDYGSAGQVWDGVAGCDHAWGEHIRVINNNNGNASHTAKVAFNQDSRYSQSMSAFCQTCGAWRGALGLEPTPALYVAHLVAVFRAVWRVLRDDGTLWLNLGDSYAGSWGAQSRPDGTDDTSTLQRGSLLSARQIAAHPKLPNGTGSLKNTPGLKNKDLIGLPWRVAFALQDAGWTLRSDIIWSKPNPMPESVTDRPTKSHEYLFLLTKSEKYSYDADAIREAGEGYGRSERFRGSTYTHNHSFHNDAKEINATGGGRPLRDGSGRNKRSVWTIPTQPYPDAHFATFPPKLIEPCILAGSQPGETVLDPFMGSGTTLFVAKAHGRQGIGLELSPAYCDLAICRLRQGVLDFEGA